MSEELIHTVAETENGCPNFEIPFQAGSDRILESMRWGYTPAEYREIISAIRKLVPDASINTDVIVDCPGEGFAGAIKLAEDLLMDKRHILFRILPDIRRLTEQRKIT